MKEVIDLLNRVSELEKENEIMKKMIEEMKVDFDKKLSELSGKISGCISSSYNIPN